MSSAAVPPQAIPRPERVPDRLTLAWLWDFLLRELAPFPGRTSLVLRMTIAASLVALVIMVFQIPYGALGGFFALAISREDLRSTATQALLNLAAFSLGAVYMLFGMLLFAGSPVGRFLWVIGTFYLIFFVMRVVRNYGAAAGFSFLIASAIPLWDGPAPAEIKVRATLWTMFGVGLGSASTLLVETIYRAFHPRDSVVSGLVDRLRSVEAVLRCYAAGHHPQHKLRGRVLQYAMVGPGSLRRSVIRTGEPPHMRAQVAALISLTGRLLDILAGLERAQSPNEAPGHRSPLPPLQLAPGDTERLLALADGVRVMADALDTLNRIEQAPTLSIEPWFGPETPSATFPVLPALEGTVAMLRAIYSPLQNEPRDAELISLLDTPRRTGPLLPDAFTNRDHQLFALRGCLAASLCYVFYNGVAWPGINTSVATCIITALGTVGSSRQKQLLRVGGAIAGGFLIALPAQVFLLPSLDSITAFLLFFAAANVIASWFSTSSPRLSYFGLQMALAFDLVNLGEFAFQTSLTVARDRVVGVLTGLVAMWIAFESFGAPRASASMLRLLAQLLDDLHELTLAITIIDVGTAEDRRDAMLKAWHLRERINSGFSTMNDQADALQFETGARRHRNLLALEKMSAMQPSMRTVYLLQIALGQFRLALAESTAVDQQHFIAFQHATAQLLAHSAARVRLYAHGEQSTDDLAPSLAEVHASFHALESVGETAGLALTREVTRALELLVEAEMGTAEVEIHLAPAPSPAL